ncbi:MULTISPECIES: thioesterase II family protein [unclassified Pseudoalteromonas]|uniref:thioesterase II family protein n=1 Tax=unclassified Pseudoalteromonas TaxID=194690 RepID=UPI0003F5536F|nr:MULTISPECIES: alpha/beta fold hydrolase [unclassified Pseudoalteromonas]PCC14209.1 thioesterase [Pseudoalteromonas sp. JB197]SJN16448.1 Thioesterase in siderophore biosynthesis gene cluster [Pseudoalteromonas sp. JB197]
MSQQKVNLVCLPFAGAGASFFAPWSGLNPYFNLVPIQLLGREKRFSEPCYTSVVQAAKDIAQEIPELVDNSLPTVLFGHSLGAVLAFEVAHQILKQAIPLSLQSLIVSGSPDPWNPREARATGLDDDAFLQQVATFSGYTHPALTDPFMRELLLPTLRADVAMHESYKPDFSQGIQLDIIALRGIDDELVSREQLLGWQKATQQSLRCGEMPGGHMFFVDTPADLLNAIELSLN